MLLWIIAVVAVVIGGWMLSSILAPSKNKGGSSIDAFIEEREEGEGSSLQSNKADPYRRVWLLPGKQILILYGTEYGFAEQLGRKLYDEILKLGEEFQPRLLNLGNYDAVDFSQEQVVLFICSTSGDGVPPTESRPFFDWISNHDLDLKHLRFAVLGLGDSAYPHFCKAGKTLFQRIATLAGPPFVSFQTVDLEDWNVINGWFSEILQSIPTLLISERPDYLDVESIGDKSTGPSRMRPFFGPLVERRDLTDSSNNEKEVIHCEFDIRGSGLEYTAGDALGIYPLNNPPEVDGLLASLQLFGDTNVQIEIPSCYAPAPEGNKLLLKEALRKYFDLKTVTIDFVKFLVEHSTSQDEKEFGLSLLSKGMGVKENSQLRNYIYEREFADALLDFKSTGVTIPKIVSFLRPLQPRYYSISSSPKVGNGSFRVSATVATVRYQTLGKPRTGVCSTFLCDRIKIGEDCALFISKNSDFRLPPSPSTPIIMIGPGTGIAPFRAFLQERTTNNGTKNILYFGCRSRNVDFLYKQELEQLQLEGKMTLRVAFSREQKEKVYVQHLIKQDSLSIWNLIQEGAHIYICGDASQMARDVHDALLSICQSEGKMGKEEAEHFLNSLEQQSRYQKDVWVT